MAFTTTYINWPLIEETMRDRPEDWPEYRDMLLKFPDENMLMGILALESEYGL